MENVDSVTGVTGLIGVDITGAGTKMASFFDYVNDLKRNARNVHGITDVWNSLYNTAYNNSHGAKRYYLSQAPVFGWAKQLEDRGQFYQDYYNATGKDNLYAQNYAGANSNSVGGISSGVFQPVRMARSIGKLYGADVMENVSFSQRKLLANQFERTADKWLMYQQLKQ